MQRKGMNLIRGHSGKGTGRLLITGTIILCGILGVGDAVTAEKTEVPQGPAPIVESTEVGIGEPYRMSSDEATPVPNHPPIAEIPPMPMPENTGTHSESSGPVEGILRDLEKGETTLVPAAHSGLYEEFAMGGGYAGADGGESPDDPAAMSGSMTLITNTESSPWRMNAKLVMRFEDSVGGSHYAVCSGSMRDAEAVLTAGHCIYDYGGYGWAKQVWVYPGWDGVGGQWNPPPSIINPYGFGSSHYLLSMTGWTGSGDLNYDIGLVGLTRAVGTLTGWYGWAYGGSCDWQMAKTYHNGSYPAENCGGGLHTGLDMYYWYGSFDSCPDWNRIRLNTTGGCLGAVWGGMSGSGAYYIDGTSRYVHAITSTSNRSTSATFTRQWDSWVTVSNDAISDVVRGSVFDLQPLDVNAAPAIIPAGSSTTLLNHLAVNATNGSASDTWSFRVYLSTNDNISSSDTLLSTQHYTWTFNGMDSIRINMAAVTIPSDTPEGDYYLGLVYDSATDGSSFNNDTDGWDPVPIHVDPAPVVDPTPDIEANGSDKPIQIRSASTLSVTVALDSGSFTDDDADWWIVVNSPVGWYHYKVPSSWQPGQSVTHQGPLFDVSTMEVLNRSGLPPGTYTFYFGVDMIMNGSVDMGAMFYDPVVVTIIP